MAHRLGELLMRMGALKPDELASALRARREPGERLGEYLVAQKLVGEEVVLKALALQRRVPVAETRWVDKVDPGVVNLITANQARQWQAVPLQKVEGTLLLVTAQPDNVDQVVQMAMELGMSVMLFLARKGEVQRALARHYPEDGAGATVASSRVPDGDGAVDVAQLRAELAAEAQSPAPRTRPAESDVVARAGSPRVVRLRSPADSYEPGPMGITRVEQRDVDAVSSPKGEPVDNLVDPAQTLGKGRRLTKAPVPSRAANNFNETLALDPREIEEVKRQSEVPRPAVDENNATIPLDPRQIQQVRQTVKPYAAQAAAPPDAPGDGNRTLAARAPVMEQVPRTPTVVAAAPASKAAPVPSTPPLQNQNQDEVGGFKLPPASWPAGQQTPFDDPAALPGPPVVPARPAEERFGNYVLVKRIKAGGMAEVFLAKTVGVEGFEKHVAIKRVLPHISTAVEFIEMFIDEARITSQLNHANIASVLEFGREGGAYYLVMEYVHGKDVNALFKDAFRKKQPLPIPLCCYVVQQLCEGLDYAHRKKDEKGRDLCIIHRDISPANILVSYEGAVKIIDFGIAKAVSKLSMTRPGLIKGKISYMSPEQMKGNSLDHRSDIFAAGIILHELLSCRKLFATKSDMETIRNVMKNPIPLVSEFRPEVPEELVRMVNKALDRDVDKRYAWASELAADLQSFMLRNGMQSARAELVRHLESMKDAAG